MKAQTLRSLITYDVKHNYSHSKYQSGKCMYVHHATTDHLPTRFTYSAVLSFVDLVQTHRSQTPQLSTTKLSSIFFFAPKPRDTSPQTIYTLIIH